MSEQNWRFVGAVPRRAGLGPLWLVERERGGRRQVGYFKFASPHPRLRMGTILASELISNHLGRA